MCFTTPVRKCKTCGKQSLDGKVCWERSAQLFRATVVTGGELFRRATWITIYNDKESKELGAKLFGLEERKYNGQNVVVFKVPDHRVKTFPPKDICMSCRYKTAGPTEEQEAVLRMDELTNICFGIEVSSRDTKEGLKRSDILQDVSDACMVLALIEAYLLTFRLDPPPSKAFEDSRENFKKAFKSVECQRVLLETLSSVDKNIQKG